MNFFPRIKRRLRSFSGRVFSGLLLAMLIMVIIINLVFIDLQKNILTRQIIAAGTNEVELLAYTIRLGVFAENVEQLRSPVQVVLERPGVMGIFVYDRYGRQFYTEQRPGSAMIGKACAVQHLPAPNESDGDKHTTVQVYDDSFCFRAPVAILSPADSLGDFYLDDENRETQKEVIGFVQIITDKEALRQGLRAVVSKGLLLTFVFIIMTMLVTFLVVRQASRPIEGLLLKVREMTGSREEVSEIDFLNQTFLDLVDNLQNSFQTINDLKLNLEEKVARRTAQLSQRHKALVETNLRLTAALTELRNTQSRLVQSEKMASLGQLVAGIAHEINNTTNFISGALPSLKRTIEEIKKIVGHCQAMTANENEAEIKDFKKEGLNSGRLLDDADTLFANISEGVRRTGDIVCQLRSFSRHDEAVSKDVDVNESLDNALALVLPEYKDRITVIREYDRRISLVACMPGKINQVFLNLLLNAMQAVSGQGTVTVKTRQQDGNVHVLIKDSGCGIVAGDLEKIFDPFFTSKEAGAGTGLGLSISYAIIEEHGGEILVESSEGHGAEFEVVLPVSPKNAPGITGPAE